MVFFFVTCFHFWPIPKIVYNQYLPLLLIATAQVAITAIATTTSYYEKLMENKNFISTVADHQHNLKKKIFKSYEQVLVKL